MKYNLSERIVKDIAAFARKHDIQKVVLFGSRARGTHSERSDVDIAVSGGDFDAFYWDIKEHVHSLLFFDIASLDSGVSKGLKEEIERDGVTIYEKA
ncbi:MAG: nucleotidyltransferase domain-containing protein [Lachnospiraceae bacterium]|nr:nucleotidyltransferase domain-containing protein [Lachnospiraceae bacterium]